MAATWNPARAWIERTIAKEAERRTALVTEGEDSPTYARSLRRGVLRFGVAMLALAALVAFVPHPYEELAAVVAMLTGFATVRHGAFRDTAAARTYFDGWVDGRMALYNRLVDEIPKGYEALVEALQVENHRDIEVLLDVRTTRAPDDLSGLDDL